MDTTYNIRIIGVNREQEEAISIFLNSMDWEYLQIEVEDNQANQANQAHEAATPFQTQEDGARTHRNAHANNGPNVPLPEPWHADLLHEDGHPTCDYCFLQPCVTTHRQAWLQDQQPPKDTNNKIRKKMYRKFWSVMEYRGAWHHPLYMEKKIIALGGEPDHNLVWESAVGQHVREIMPDCILKLVRGLYPNPPGVAYMGHRWAV